jgi:hypothetical protein
LQTLRSPLLVIKNPLLLQHNDERFSPWKNAFLRDSAMGCEDCAVFFDVLPQQTVGTKACCWFLT